MGEPGRERRSHRRYELTCPVVVVDADGQELFHTDTVDVSDGGLRLRPVEKVLPPGQTVHVNLRVPRQTPNSFMYEEFFSQASVVRCQYVAEGTKSSMALRFTRPLKLELEV